jgi:hypothetical protein
MRHLLLALLLLTAGPAAAQNFGNIKPNTVIGNPDPSASKPAAPIPFSTVGKVISPKQYGAVGDGTANDTAAVQSALDAASSAGYPLVMSDGLYRIMSGLTASGAVIIDAGPLPGIYQPSCDKGIKVGAANIPAVLTLNGKGSRFRGCIDGSGVTNTAGIGIKVRADNIEIEAQVIRTFVGVDVSCPNSSGSGQVVGARITSGVYIPANQAGAQGIRIGIECNAANTVDVWVRENSIYCTDAPLADGVVYYDAGGPWHLYNDIFKCQHGTRFLPGKVGGTGQAITFATLTGVLGDTSGANDFLADTTDAAASILGNQFTGCWASSSTGAGASFTVRNTANATVRGVYLDGCRLLFVNKGVEFAGSGGTIKDITITATHVCSSTPAGIGITFSGAVEPSFVGGGTVVGGECAQFSGVPIATGIDLGLAGSVAGVYDGIQMIGTVTPINYHPAGVTTVNFANIIGVTNSGTNVTTAASITLSPLYQMVNLAGTTSITSIAAGVANQQAYLYAHDGAVNLNGALCGGTSKSIALQNMQKIIFRGGENCWAAVQ